MKLLALDTATEACSAAVYADGAVLERYEVLGRGHAERLLPMVDELLAESGLVLGDLAAVACGRGPGAFTGVRIAVSLAQGLAFGAGLPVIPVSDLAALGCLALDETPGVPSALACLDARLGEVYWAVVERRAAGGVVLSGEHLGPPESVTLADVAGPLVAAGHGWASSASFPARFAARVAAARPELLPRAATVAQLAALEAAAGHLLPPEEAVPVYLRDDVATRPRAAGERAARMTLP